MKNNKTLFTTLILMVFIFYPMKGLNAQILDRLADKAVDAAERTVEDRVQKESAKKTDQVLDGLLGGNKKEKPNSNKKNSTDADGFEGAVEGAMKSGSLHANAGSDLKCPIMEVGEVYVGAASPTTKRKVIPQEDNSCGYEIDIFGGKIPLTLTAHKMSESQMNKEIKNYKNDPSGMLSTQNSSFGNITFGIHKPNKWLMVFDLSNGYIYKFDFSTNAYSSIYPDKNMVDFEKAKKTVINIADHFIKNKP